MSGMRSLWSAGAVTALALSVEGRREGAASRASESFKVPSETVTSRHLNKVPYSVANDDGHAPVLYQGASFDVYSPELTSTYGLVHWPTVNVTLPDDIRAAFKGKTMAITGYEVDIVETDSVTGLEKSVECYRQYNHHYVHYVLSEDTVFVGGDTMTSEDYHDLGKVGVTYTGDREVPEDAVLGQVFSEGNGNEHRASFHGYPRGYAQHLYSPSVMVMSPMVIDTVGSSSHDGGGYAPLPATSTGTVTGDYSPLLECPCTTRLSINITNSSIGGEPFDNDTCLPWPRSDLINQRNPSCNIATYTGGLRCCSPGDVLVDKGVKVPVGEHKWRMKVRFWYNNSQSQETRGRKIESKELYRLYHQTEDHHGEYDIPPCTEGSSCVHVITSRFNTSQLMSEDWCSKPDDHPWCPPSGSIETRAIDLVYAGPHCHAPNCLEMTLLREDTGEELCSSRPRFGTGSDAMDERGYAVEIAPCVWGSGDEGWQTPPRLEPGTVLLAVAKQRQSVGMWHRGQMASWQMRGAFSDID